MPWMRLDPIGVANALRLDYEPGSEAEEDAAVQALDYLRQQLATGAYIAVQDHEGHTFIGTPDEATERMMVS